ncbi:SUN domain-containing protein 1 [Orycteropus afer afer]|uniref:SUN domain-containing protein 1 n=1 Tax=Orycteropus afer afer TaxID=1230840 RepID=A0AC54ZB33_ORYAF|nr:SUN domain-containing protein 1 [Orycteropus afer afer]
MDFSRLHMYTPPQCVPENTGYTYALSSSYSSEALDFETEHRLDPVFDSPRMSRRSLRLITPAFHAGDGPDTEDPTCTRSSASVKDRVSRTVKQRRTAGKPAFSINHMSRTATCSAVSQSSCRSLQGNTAFRPPVLDASLIQEQTQVDHFWGLDDDSDLKGGSKAAVQGNGDLGAATDATTINGYTCSDCSLLSARRDVLTAHPTALGPTSRVYSRDRNQKCGASSYVNRTWRLAKRTSESLSSFLVPLFQVVLMKLSYESENHKLKSYESKSHEFKALSGRGGRTQVSKLLGEDARLSVDGELLCKDSKGNKEHLEGHVSLHMLPTLAYRAACYIITHAGHGLAQVLHRTATAGWLLSSAVWSALWLAIAAPGKAASGLFWWLGFGWYQLVTLVSWLNVFLLTRCLRNVCKGLVVLIPLLLFLGAGLAFWGQADFLSLLPMLNWTDVYKAQRMDDPKTILTPAASHLHLPPEGHGEAAFHWHRLSDVEHQVTSLSGRCQLHEEKLRELTLLLRSLQARADQADGDRDGVLSLVHQLAEQRAMGVPGAETDFVTFRQEHESRLSTLEAMMRRLTERAEAAQEELEQTKLRAASGAASEQHLLSTVRQLELQLEQLKAELVDWRHLQSSCEKVETIHEKVDTQVRDTVRRMFSGDLQDGALEWLLQQASSRFVSKDDLQVLLQDLELRVLRNITQHISVTKQAPTSAVVLSAAHEAGVSGITEAQARIIVNNALKLYSQDKTGMVDFALESGGGSILSTRCSETYETKTALISLFGIPLWYFSQSPRVVIQPDIYPGNCWAFKGSQGYLVVRLSMAIYPTTFTLEHIPKTLSPTGNITSAPKDFAVYGLDSEHQEEGLLLGQFTYDQDGESLQMFQVLKRPEQTFQIVELQISSNWGHPEYTCLYRFRVHGEPIK